VADYFLSDVHLRHDRSDRGKRLAKVVDRLEVADTLTVVGDLCDFWFVARQRRQDPLACPGLRSLAAFRNRGGRLTILGGNHDQSLGDFYQSLLGARWIVDDLRINSHGLRVQLMHGHRFGARHFWKAGMESRAFLSAFGALPAYVAHRLEMRLEHSNVAHRAADDRKHMTHYLRNITKFAGSVDLVVLGHVHLALDVMHEGLRMIILGDWTDRANYLRIDDQGATLVAEQDLSTSSTSRATG